MPTIAWIPAVIIAALLGYVLTRLSRLEDKISGVDSKVSKIEGFLEGAASSGSSSQEN